ncbi:FecCD family ABC transporter permease [Morganella morganii]|uniref:FecCD family ABC transporter permease n=2 Tax=Morganella morganii TaxID=582 RepID=UPI0035233D1A
MMSDIVSETTIRRKEKLNFRNVSQFFICLSVLLGAMFFSLFYGSVNMEFHQKLNTVISIITGSINSDDLLPYETIIYNIRLPRIILVAITGASLSLVGILMQTITRNELADPYILGVSSGASAGAVSAIVLGLFAFMSPYNVYIGAFAGGLISTAIIVLFNFKKSNMTNLVLIGIGISSLFSAITTAIIYLSKNESQVKSAMFWMLGSFSGIKWSYIPLPLVALIAVLIFCLLFSNVLDTLLLGADASAQLGVNVGAIKLGVIILSSFVVSIIVANVGVIAFIGLIIPHIVRNTISVKHFKLSLYSCLVGGAFLVVIDTISRSWFKPEEIPVGILTSLIGAPLFVYIIIKANRSR